MTAPTASVLTASNPTTNSIDLSWTPSTDNDVVLGYVVFLDGVYIGDAYYPETSVTVPYLAANTTYEFFIASRDITGNFSPSSNIVTETTLGGVSTSVIHKGYFENNSWDGWTDGGNDAYLYNGTKSFEGTGSIRLRDNSGVKSSILG